MAKQTKEVKLFGGPMAGRTVTVDRSADQFVVLTAAPMWVYTFAGKEGRQEIFAIRPRKRAANRIIKFYIAKMGRDPRLEAEYHKRRPAQRIRVAHGRGAARRKAKREAATT